MFDPEGFKRRSWLDLPGLVYFAAKADAGDADDDDADDDDDDEDDDGLEALTPAELATQLREAKANLARAVASRTDSRTKTRSLKGELARVQGELASRGKKRGKDDDDDEDERPDVEAIRNAARNEGARSKEVSAIKASGRGILKGLGASKDDLGALVRLLDIEDLELDDDGEVDGLDDQAIALKVRYPAMFGTKTKRRNIAGGSSDDAGTPKEDKRSDSQKQADAILGKG